MMNSLDVQGLIYTMVKGCTSITDGVVLLNGDHIILRDGDQSILVYIPLTMNTETILGIELVEFIQYYTAMVKDKTPFKEYNNQYYIYSELEELYRRYSMVDTYQQLLYSIDDMREYEIFENQLNQKADNAMGWMRLANDTQRFIYPISKFITPVNKPDSLSLNIYSDTVNTNIYHYELFKKKHKTKVHIYMRLLIA